MIEDDIDEGYIGGEDATLSNFFGAVCKLAEREAEDKITEKAKKGEGKRVKIKCYTTINEGEIRFGRAVEEKYSSSHICKLCGEEIVWSITEHLVDKHPNIPEVKAYRAWASMLWAKFVESK